MALLELWMPMLLILVYFIILWFSSVSCHIFVLCGKAHVKSPSCTVGSTELTFEIVSSETRANDDLACTPEGFYKDLERGYT